MREVGACLAEALAYVHDQGVVHRDVKPGNVLFIDAENDRRIKLADFGIARLADSASLTDAGLVVGSARYLSPEQALGAGVGPPTDVYALGLVLLECLTGAPAYPGAGIAAAVTRLHRDPSPRPHRPSAGSAARRDDESRACAAPYRAGSRSQSQSGSEHRAAARRWDPQRAKMPRPDNRRRQSVPSAAGECTTGRG